MQETVSNQRDHTAWQASVLAVVAGFADTVGFLSFKAFAGLMTGNTILLGISLAGWQWMQALYEMGIIVSFLLGICVTTLLRRLWVPMAGLVAIEMVVILVAAFISSNLAAFILALAMGIQNAMATRFVGLTLNTVFLTGNLQKLMLAILTRTTYASGRTDRISVILILWSSYLFGAALGAVMQTTMAHPLILAVLPLPLILLRKNGSYKGE